MKIGCMVYAVGDAYEWMSECAVRSFKKYHPDIEVHHITRENFNTFKASKFFGTKFGGRHEVYRWVVALEIWKEKQYDKMIMLGADTITCEYLSEFIHATDIAAVLTLDDPYQISIDAVPRDPKTGEFVASSPIREIYTPMVLVDGEKTLIIPDSQSGGDYVITLPVENPGTATLDHTHCNADVVCFNNMACLKHLVEYYFRYMKDYEFMKQRALTLAKNPPSGTDPEDWTWALDFEKSKPFYGEQGALNLFAALSVTQAYHSQEAEMYGYKELLNYKVGFADTLNATPEAPGVRYNTRSYRNKEWTDKWNEAFKSTNTSMEIDPRLSTREFRVDNKKLYTSDGHQIKVWHYGHGILSEADPRQHLAEFVSSHFNDQTVAFFQQECDSREFFEDLVTQYE